MRPKIPMQYGSIFGKLTVIGEATPRKYPCGQTARRIMVKCECGKTKIVPLGSLTTGNTKSCGCAARKSAVD